MNIVERLFELCAEGKLRLGGSRYFAERYPTTIQVTEDTDYDFYCADVPEVRRALAMLGMTEMVNFYGKDDLFVTMFLSPDSKCQVLVRSRAALYREVMESISPTFYRDFLWKSGPNTPPQEQIRAIMNQLFRTAGHININE